MTPKKVTHPRRQVGRLDYKGNRCDKVGRKTVMEGPLPPIRLKTVPLTRPNGPNTRGLAKTLTITPWGQTNQQTKIALKIWIPHRHIFIFENKGGKKIPLLY